MQTVEEFEKACCAAIDAHVANGGKILFKDFGVFNNHDYNHVYLAGMCGCALSIMVNGMVNPCARDLNSLPIYAIARILNLEEGHVEDFVIGFDDSAEKHMDEVKKSPWYQAGLNVRQHVINKHFESVVDSSV